MKQAFKLIVTVISGVALSSCFEPPEYPDDPSISFQSIEFVDVPDSQEGVEADSLILSIKFRDGNGDLGLSPNEVQPPFNDRWFILRAPLDGNLYSDCAQAGNKCWYLVDPSDSEYEKYISFADKRNATSENDTLKPYVAPYKCNRWQELRDDHDVTKVIDTLYYILNPHYANIFVEFQIKNISGGYDILDWGTYLAPNCGEVRGYDGRFPDLNPERNEAPLEGVIRYGMVSSHFRTLFGNKTLRLKVYIEDRAQHRSNEVLTEDFVL